MPLTAEEALRVGKETERVYVPRIIHVDWKSQVHVLIGRASHVAWAQLALKYKTLRLRGYDKFKEHKQMTGALMKAWCWELVEDAIKKAAGAE